MSFLAALQNGEMNKVNKYLASNPGYSFLKAAYDGKIDDLKRLDIADLMDIKDKSGAGVIHYAAAGGNKLIIGWLFAKHVDIKATDNNGMTAIHYAVTEDQPGTVSYLIGIKVDVTRVDIFGRTAMHWAAIYGCNNVINYLIFKQLDVNTETSSGKTALHYAVENGFEETIDLLIEKGADTSAADKQGKTVMDYAGNNSSIKFCLMKHRRGLSLSDDKFKPAQLTIKRNSFSSPEQTAGDHKSKDSLPSFARREINRKRNATDEVNRNTQKLIRSSGREL